MLCPLGPPRLFVDRSSSIVVMTGFRDPARRFRRSRVRTGSAVAANTAHIGQALFNGQKVTALVAELAEVLITAPWLFLSRHSRLCEVADGGENSQHR